MSLCYLTSVDASASHVVMAFTTCRGFKFGGFGVASSGVRQ